MYQSLIEVILAWFQPLYRSEGQFPEQKATVVPNGKSWADTCHRSPATRTEAIKTYEP